MVVMVIVFLLIKTRHIAVSGLVSYFYGYRAGTLQCVGFLSAPVHRDDLMRTRCRERRQVSCYMRVLRIGHGTCQRIGGKEIERGIFGLQLDMTCR